MLGLDLGGTSLKGGLVTAQGDLLYTSQVESHLLDEPDGIADKIVSLIDRLKADAFSKNINLCGVGLSSTIDVEPQSGCFLDVNYSILSKWVGYPIASYLENCCGLPVRVENDGVAATWGEFRVGAGAGSRSLILVTLGTGIGGGAVLEGQRLPETLGHAAYFGHMSIDFNGPLCACGRRGCWELYASATALEQHAARSLQSSVAHSSLPDHPTAKDLAEAARASDPLARKLFDEAGYFLGIGLVNLANLFNPGLIVVGGGLSLAGDLLLLPARKILNEQRLAMLGSVSLVAAKYPLFAGFIGAALLAWEQFG
jgi:glucokinase